MEYHIQFEYSTRLIKNESYMVPVNPICVNQNEEAFLWEYKSLYDTCENSLQYSEMVLPIFSSAASAPFSIAVSRQEEQTNLHQPHYCHTFQYSPIHFIENE